MSSRDPRGTPGYQDPVMVKALQHGPARVNGFAADAWSWGVMMWEGALLSAHPRSQSLPWMVTSALFVV